MSVVKEYLEDKTKIKIHNDYVNDEDKSIKEMIISLMINYLKAENT